MKLDKFTKIVLTVIAVNLTFLSLKEANLITRAHAEGDDPVFSVQRYGIVPVNDDGSITVRLSEYDKVDVNIVDINTSDKLNVHVISIGRFNMPIDIPCSMQARWK